MVQRAADVVAEAAQSPQVGLGGDLNSSGGTESNLKGSLHYGFEIVTSLNKLRDALFEPIRFLAD